MCEIKPVNAQIVPSQHNPHSILMHCFYWRSCTHASLTQTEKHSGAQKLQGYPASFINKKASLLIRYIVFFSNEEVTVLFQKELNPHYTHSFDVNR